MQPTEPEFEVASARVAHGDLVAVWDVSLELHPGRVTALVGRNGAGKTTLLSGLSGLLPLQSGTVTMGGEDITAAPPWARTARGLSIVHEGKRVFRDLTVRENLMLGLRGAGLKRSQMDAELEGLYDRFAILGDRRNQRASDLSGGQQQMLAIATRLATRPRVLLVDEPSSGLAPVFVDQVFGVLQTLREEGLAILLVEQLVEEVLGGMADDVIVLERGKVTLRGQAADLTVDDVANSIYTSS